MEQTTKRRSRRRPLETCGGVLLFMASVVYKRSQTLKKKNNPVSSLLKKLFEFVIFFVSLTRPFHRHVLTILSVADDHILALQNAIETYFPSSSFVFVKIFDLLIIAESLPEKLDRCLKKLRSMMNRVAWLDWVLIYTISWLDLLVNVLGRWRNKNKRAKEKEIKVEEGEEVAQKREYREGVAQKIEEEAAAEAVAVTTRLHLFCLFQLLVYISV